jgi:hypothetical protein
MSIAVMTVPPVLAGAKVHCVVWAKPGTEPTVQNALVLAVHSHANGWELIVRTTDRPDAPGLTISYVVDRHGYSKYLAPGHI